MGAGKGRKDIKRENTKELERSISVTKAMNDRVLTQKVKRNTKTKNDEETLSCNYLIDM